jgi:hypothetical protein
MPAKMSVVWKRLLLLLFSIAVCGIGASARGPEPAQRDETRSADSLQTSRPASTTLRMRGTISKFDASTRILSLSTSKGLVQFSLGSTARIREAWQKIDALELEKLVGYRAVIRYSESNGTKTVESVHVFVRNGRMER